MNISDDWTFEFCLAKYGLLGECYEAVNGSRDGLEGIIGTDDEKATYILSKTSKTDFAYKLPEILEKQREQKVSDEIAALEEDQRNDRGSLEAATERANSAYALELKEKLPSYIIDAIEYVTAPIVEEELVEGRDDDESA